MRGLISGGGGEAYLAPESIIEKTTLISFLCILYQLKYK